MRPSSRRAIPVQSRERRLKDAGLSGARALTRLLVALIENIGQHDKMGRRRDPEWSEPSAPPPQWPHGTTRTAFGPTPLGPELDRLMARHQAGAAEVDADAGSPMPRRDAITGLPIRDGRHEDDVQDNGRATLPPVAPIPAQPHAPMPEPMAPQPEIASRAEASPAAPHPPVPRPGAVVGFARGQVRAKVQAQPEPVVETPPAPTAEVPNWQKPFIAAPGVRYMRTPDHVLRHKRDLSEPLAPIRPCRVPDASAADLAMDTLDLDDVEEIGVFEAEAIGLEETLGDPLPSQPATLMRRARPPALVARRAKPQPTRAPEPEPAALDLAEPHDAGVSTPHAKAAFAVAVRPKPKPQAEPAAAESEFDDTDPVEDAPLRLAAAAGPLAPARRRPRPSIEWCYPPVDLLDEVVESEGHALTTDILEQNARMLESTLEDFGVRGEIIHVRAGPVVTLYELEPAPGVKSSRVIGLADDIARSMSALSARVAVVPGRNAIGIELPNERRETVYFREMIESEAFTASPHKLAIALGKTIGGEPVIAELAKMPHLLVAGTTGSGKSVAINTMILSLLYRLKPEECRLIMVDPKMLELSVYDGIPHLLTPVVTDPKKAVVALKWAVREMEDRYKKMSKLGVRNIDGFNARVKQAQATGETITIQVTTGFERETGRPVQEDQPLDLTPLPYIVVIVDEMADLMMVAGKDIEGAIQRLAQMARAAGIHLIMATQRPSVDVITGTIKANFPTRISFQVTSKIDSRTILGEQGAEQLLGQGDMLHMAGGGRIYRVHGPFVSDADVERVVAHLKAQREPDYLDSVTDELDGEVAEAEVEDEDSAVFDKTAMGEEDGDLYEQAVKIVLRDKKTSVSYVQRRLQVGYNKAASLIEKMEKNGVLSAPSHSGKREILAASRTRIITGALDADEA